MDAITPTGAVPLPVGVQEPRSEKPEVATPPPAKIARDDASQPQPKEAPGSAGAAGPPKLIRSPGFSGDGLHLRIEIDESGGFVYLAVDSETGEVVRQYPPEEVLERLKPFQEPVGLTVDRKF